MTGCCCKVICKGCDRANKKREVERRLAPSCQFCRELLPNTKEEADRLTMKRVEANDPAAMCQMGGDHFEKGNYSTAFDYFTKAAELGKHDASVSSAGGLAIDAEAHYQLSQFYVNGHGVVEKDKRKEIYHLEEASIGGHPYARHNLGCDEWNNGSKERAVTHWIIAATQGFDGSMQLLMEAFKEGFVEKDVLAATLRAQKAAVEATKSPQRQAAEEWKVNRDRLG